MLPLGVDTRHQLRQMHAKVLSDGSQFMPKYVFKTDTGLMAPNHD